MSIRLLAVSAALAFAAMGAQAASCEAQATERKLAGAAKNSFVQKCERDAKAAPAAAAPKAP